MKTQEKCHSFWKTNRNPITMKKNTDFNLHHNNLSKEQEIALAIKREDTSDIREIMEHVKEMQND
tara:strand:+ start:1085 stop:1279 length:195 start_codon:yes stop_codon:yes gene_type:complete